jgi:hypothetical protein
LLASEPRRWKAWLGASSAGAAAIAGVLAGCNSILGINEASLEPEAGAAAADTYRLDCSSYCNVINTNCGMSGTQDNREYLSLEVCRAICPQFEQVRTPNGSVDPNEPTPTTDTLNCRVWHANAAAGPGEAHVHCPHAGPLGAHMCENNRTSACGHFCNLDLAFCTGANAAYKSVEECMSACLPDGGYPGYPYNVNPADTEVTDLAASGNTLNCRMYHLENFLFTHADVHCSHTSQDGGGVCSN